MASHTVPNKLLSRINTKFWPRRKIDTLANDDNYLLELIEVLERKAFVVFGLRYGSLLNELERSLIDFNVCK
ncbi:hypothetical protein BpHYR1_046938 [Brachionus plicatilis]|uniref:Uncharacterized protein n=1 Tax=Brachionus plicatilis TaxID=10195 RepID=A0A3M7RG69_BRAPC|nr:hypothetical protein BpHYR1_046938 [Brachionus plicatilis]